MAVTPTNPDRDVRKARRELGKVQRKLKEVTEQTRRFLAHFDRIMEGPSTVERGKALAHLCNALAMYNDGVRYGFCGVDYRKDTPYRLKAVEARDEDGRSTAGRPGAQ